jgi:hypothetical protein
LLAAVTRRIRLQDTQTSKHDNFYPLESQIQRWELLIFPYQLMRDLCALAKARKFRENAAQ